MQTSKKPEIRITRSIRSLIAFAIAFALASAVLRPQLTHADDRCYPSFFCDHFSFKRAYRWYPEGGKWTVANKQYVGYGTFATPNNCSFEYGAQTVIRWFQARNVMVELDMTSIQRVDKMLILRSADPANQIELNFRAERPGGYPADLIVQERANNCEYISHTPEFSVLIPPHQIGQTIHVRTLLVDNQLLVWIDGVLVLNQSFPFSNQQVGNVGLQVIVGDGITAFDNVRVFDLGD